MTITIRQLHTLETAQVAAVISAHYKAMNVPVEPSQITHQVFEGSTGGFSTSGPRLGDTTIRFFGKKPVGMPDSMTLSRDNVCEIVAAFFEKALGFKVTSGALQVNVSGASGGGFSSRSARLDSITLSSTLQA